MIRRLVLMLLLGASTFALLGCISTSRGTEFNTENVQKIEIGKTTEQEVIQLIGQPYSRSISGDGSIVLLYMYDPGLSAFGKYNPRKIADAGKNVDRLSVSIGPDGTVRHYSFTET